MNLTATAFGHATAPPDGVNLAKYPGLCYAPQQHGEGVRFAHNGRPVGDVLDAEDVGGAARTTLFAVEAMAESFGVSFGDVLDALKYLHDQGVRFVPKAASG